MVNKHDYAILVGVEQYEFINKPIEGPNNDVKALRDWLVSEGRVPRNNIHSIINPSNEEGKPTWIDVSRPIHSIIDKMQPILINQGDPSLQTAGTKPVYPGRRLYIYVAGHGYATNKNINFLLMANGDDNTRIGEHFPCVDHFNGFLNSAYFEEVILWMDTCADQVKNKSTPVKNTFQWPVENDVVYDLAEGCKSFQGFAAMRGRKAGAASFKGAYMGYFTKALIDGLQYAKEADSDEVTSNSLSNYLLNAIPELSGSLSESKTKQVPSIIVSNASNNPQQSLSFGKAKPLNATLELHFAEDCIGETFILSLKGKCIKEIEVGKEPCIISNLDIGLYEIKNEALGFNEFTHVFCPDRMILNIEKNGNITVKFDC